MGGAIDWPGVPMLAEVLGISDLEQLVHDLAQIREARRPQD